MRYLRVFINLCLIRLKCNLRLYLTKYILLCYKQTAKTFVWFSVLRAFEVYLLMGIRKGWYSVSVAYTDHIHPLADSH